MGYEIDFLAVGDNSKSGDAIALRFGNLYGEREEQAIVVIDGGFKDDGQKLIDLIKKYYADTDTIDLVIATHPHGDHVAGLETILTEMQVKEFWMHKPWDENHTNNISKWFTDGRVTDNSVREALRKSLDSARELERIAKKKGLPILEPFVGMYKDFGFGRIDIAGPTEKYYESLLPDFAGRPEPKKAESYGFLERAITGAKEFVKKIAESWGLETLDDNGETNAENNSSVISLLRIDDKHLLLTGDAGIPALTNAIDILEDSSVTHEDYNLVQVPHHGSKRNVGPTILNRMVGPKLPEEQRNTKKLTAFCSCAKEGEPKHPSKKVTNAFKRRGAPVCVTQGNSIRHQHDAPNRTDYSTISPLPFYEEVEE